MPSVQTSMQQNPRNNTQISLLCNDWTQLPTNTRQTIANETKTHPFVPVIIALGYPFTGSCTNYLSLLRTYHHRRSHYHETHSCSYRHSCLQYWYMSYQQNSHGFLHHIHLYLKCMLLLVSTQETIYYARGCTVWGKCQKSKWNPWVAIWCLYLVL